MVTLTSKVALCVGVTLMVNVASLPSVIADPAVMLTSGFACCCLGVGSGVASSSAMAAVAESALEETS